MLKKQGTFHIHSELDSFTSHLENLNSSNNANPSLRLTQRFGGTVMHKYIKVYGNIKAIGRKIHTYTNEAQPFKLCIMISHLSCCFSPTHLTINYIVPQPFTHKSINSNKNPTSETIIHSKHRYIFP